MIMQNNFFDICRTDDFFKIFVNYTKPKLRMFIFVNFLNLFFGVSGISEFEFEVKTLKVAKFKVINSKWMT